VGGLCDILVGVRKVGILWCEESEIFCAVGGKGVFRGRMKVIYVGLW